MVYGNQGYGQSSGYGNRSGGGYGGGHRGPARTVKGRLDFVNEEETRTGKLIYKIGIAQKEYSCWEPEIASQLEPLIDTVVSVQVEQNGRYQNLVGINDSPEPQTSDQMPKHLSSGVARSSNGGDREAYWDKRFRLDLLQVSSGIVDNMLKSKTAVLDDYVKSGKTPKQAHLLLIQDVAEELMPFLNDEEQPAPRAHMIAPRSKDGGAPSEDFQPGA